MEDLPRGTPAWQPEVIKDEATHVEKEHFYDIVALAKWLATSPSVTTPLTRPAAAARAPVVRRSEGLLDV